MAFDQGSVTFRVCGLPEAMPKDAVERFQKKVICELSEVGDEPIIGWVSGRNLLERRIDEGTAYCGNYMHICLCQAQRKIPASLLNARIRMAELEKMAETQSNRLPRAEKKKIKEDLIAEMLPTMPPSLSGTWFVIDPAAELLYVSASSPKQLELFMAYFTQTIGFEPLPLTPLTTAEELLKVNPASIPPINFSPDLPDANAAGSLGQNFLTWLWFHLDQNHGKLPPTKDGEFGMMIDGPLSFIAEGASAQESVVRKGTPTVSPDARCALTTGKKLKQAKLLLARDRQQWEVTLDAEEFVFRGMKLPDGETLDDVSYFGERMEFIYQFQKVFFELFRRFVNEVKDEAKLKQIQAQAKLWVKGLAD
jgi:hypothetical protein